MTKNQLYDIKETLFLETMEGQKFQAPTVEKERRIYRNSEARLWKSYLILVTDKEEGTEITREELLDLADLTEYYELRPWQQFPSADDVESTIGDLAFARFSSAKTDNWRGIEKKLEELEYPPLIREIVLKSCGQPLQIPVHNTMGEKEWDAYENAYGFSKQKYEDLIKEYKNKYDEIKNILEK